MIGTAERDQLWRAQTPQGFRFDAILAAHRAAAKEPAREFTDDAGVAEWFGLDVALVEGAEDNRKLTTAEDLTHRRRAVAAAAARAAPPRSAWPRAMTCTPSAPAMR